VFVARNNIQLVALTLNTTGLATLLLDLLTREEEAIDVHTAQHRFDISLLAERARARTWKNATLTRRCAIFAGAGFFWLLIMIALALSDYLTGDWQ
jgi:hypothetical protein